MIKLKEQVFSLTSGGTRSMVNRELENSMEIAIFTITSKSLYFSNALQTDLVKFSTELM